MLGYPIFYRAMERWKNRNQAPFSTPSMKNIYTKKYYVFYNDNMEQKTKCGHQ